jgi:hypothetical protein
MTVRRTVSLPDELDRAVQALAGDNYSSFAQRAFRDAVVAYELDLFSAGSAELDEDAEHDIADTAEADAEAELATAYPDALGTRSANNFS